MGKGTTYLILRSAIGRFILSLLLGILSADIAYARRAQPVTVTASGSTLEQVPIRTLAEAVPLNRIYHEIKIVEARMFFDHIEKCWKYKGKARAASRSPNSARSNAKPARCLKENTQINIGKGRGQLVVNNSDAQLVLYALNAEGERDLSQVYLTVTDVESNNRTSEFKIVARKNGRDLGLYSATVSDRDDDVEVLDNIGERKISSVNLSEESVWRDVSGRVQVQRLAIVDVTPATAPGTFVLGAPSTGAENATGE